MNVRFEAVIGPLARWVLDQLQTSSASDFDQVVSCIQALERDPYPPPALRAPLVVPGQGAYPDAYRCRHWRIAFRVEEHAFVVIERIGRAWPPRW